MTGKSEITMTDDQKISREIIRCANIFQTGCSNAGPQAVHLTGKSDPAECAECAKIFVKRIRLVLSGAQP